MTEPAPDGPTLAAEIAAHPRAALIDALADTMHEIEDDDGNGRHIDYYRSLAYATVELLPGLAYDEDATCDEPGCGAHPPAGCPVEHAVTVAFDKHEAPRTADDKIAAAHRWGWPETGPATGPGSTQPDATAQAVAQEAPNAPGSSEGARDARAIARTWLTWAITRAASTAQGNREIADAILNTLGVEIEIDRIKRMPQEMGDDEPIEIRNPPTGMRPTHTQVVIRLPAQPIKEEA